MMRLKNILLPTDLTQRSKRALRYALSLATEYSAAITVVFVAVIYLPLAVLGGGIESRVFLRSLITPAAVALTFTRADSSSNWVR